jgi:steroid Delta-isomerase
MALSATSTQIEKDTFYRQVFLDYMAAIIRNNADEICALFSDDAELEDPVGSGRYVRGKRDVRAFFERVVGRRLRMIPNGRISGSKGNAAVAPIRVEVAGSTVNAIIVATFDDEGRITRYQAYWGPGDIEGPDPTDGQPVK